MWFVRWMTLIRFIIMVLWAMLIATFWPDIAAWMGFCVRQQDTALTFGGTYHYRYQFSLRKCWNVY